MRYQVPVEVPSSGNPWIDGLTDGYRWGTEPGDQEVGYTFISDTRTRPQGKFAGYPSWGWSDTERDLMEQALRTISDVCAIEFIDRGDDTGEDSADEDGVEIWFYNMDRKQSGNTYGFAYSPGSDSDEGLVAVNWSVYQNNDGSYKESINPGSFYGITYLHELSHAVGLKHPHDRGLLEQPRFPGLKRTSDEFKNSGDFGQNAHPWTQLSYVDKGADNGLVPDRIEVYGFLKTPGPLDIATLQWMYGINNETASGNNVYRLPTRNQEGTGWQSIWDTGGVDRIDGSRARSPVTIDLRNAELDLSENAGGHPSRVEGIFGGFTIAHDWNGRRLDQSAGLCVIENATGGKSDDLLIGNDANNVLRGRTGNDILYAGGGRSNRSFGGRGRDQFWIDANPGSFVKIRDFSKSKDLLVFNVDSDEVLMKRRKGNTDIRIGQDLVARVFGVTGLSTELHLDFSGFDGL